MRIHLTNAGTISLVEPSNFRKLDVLVDPQPSEQLEQAIARLGRREDDGHIRLAPAVLRYLSSLAGDPVWEAGFARMVDYARGAGWVDEAGLIRAHLTHTEDDATVSISEFKAAMRVLPAGICAITTGAGEQVAGMVVSSLTSISAEPPMVGFFVHRGASMHGQLTDNGRFVANVLGHEHDAVMQSLLSAPQGPARFTTGQWAPGRDGLPVLADALASLECDIICVQSLGTHDLIVGKIRRANSRAAAPVVHFNSATHRLAEPVAA